MDAHLAEVEKEWHGSLKSYLIGFVASLILTGIAFFVKLHHLLEGRILVYTLVGLAFIQAICQLRFFLHLGKEEKPQLETLVFLFMLMVLLIIVVGSLWIMEDLQDRVMGSM